MTAHLDGPGDRTKFQRRHIGVGADDRAAMLDALGLKSLDALIEKAVPKTILSAGESLPGNGDENDVLNEIEAIAAKNRVVKSMIGMGYYGTVTPPVILRNVFENPAWYTAYTPYQAEISQGRLEALLAFQQMTIDLTGLEIANASLLDEATAAAEAMTLMHRVGKGDRDTIFVAADCHPQTIAVVRTRAKPLGLKVIVVDPLTDLKTEGVFGVIVQVPGTFGTIADYRGLIERAHAGGALVAVACDLLSLVMIEPPGAWGADVAFGSAQRFGVPMGFGGPHAAFLAAHENFKRHVPGRIVGVSVDRHGRPAMRLALQTREQHIRRERATSNICTAQVLLANMAAFYAMYHGPKGLTEIATRVHRLTAILAAGLKRLGLAIENESFFDTLTVLVADADSVAARAHAEGMNLRRIDEKRVGIAFDETTRPADVEALWRALSGLTAKELRAKDLDVLKLDAATPDGIPETLARTCAFLTHPVFNANRSETDMLRYLRKLADRDIALDRSMIPLGSCTMKLNAAIEMMPLSWPQFAEMHPFQPLDQAKGYMELFRGLEKALCVLTGFAAVSLQPNAGSQGEYAGLLAIRRYHESRKDAKRDVCLIPASAHGTNPASAVMAGMSVVVVECDDQGNIDVADLKAKAAGHKDRLAALMVTYPSTHGVFEEAIRDICRVVHDAGGQVYMDGANLNALLGLARPAELGADVMHMNLHKTFCIPHGGGGPGVGPIGVAKHLAPFLPNHPLVAEAGPETGPGPVSAAPWGSALILPITWVYIRLMGSDGLRKATQAAILNANYVAKRLAPYYPVLFTGQNGMVAHECIVDPRAFKDSAGVTNEDIAKRLIDYGFHAPTVSFPVPGTLMIEPTESESKAELDRFCDALIAIHGEMKRIESGEWPKDDNPLKNAPHTAGDVMADDWKHPYSRKEAAFPLAWIAEAKYWPPVGRIDNVLGDRQLVCTCPPVEAYGRAAE